ncbi:MAG: glycogen debranching protein GlgX [Gammaproteobacteria bacterium]
MNTRSSAGRPYPLGSILRPGGANFSVYANKASAVELLLFAHVDDDKPTKVIALRPVDNCTFHYWHVYVSDVRAGQLYGYRVYGPQRPNLHFDPDKLLIDPYARGIAVGSNYDRKAACRPGSNIRSAMKSVLVDYRGYDWEGDAPLRTPFRETIIYEMHVRGFTCHPHSGVTQKKRGTYAGLIEKIPYLQDLGVTAVELLPVFQFDMQDSPLGLRNYWGYSPVSFFTPHNGYSSDPSPLGAIAEFRDMVKALHRADIEVILDVVFNHTAEGGHGGPTFCFRGFANDVYYLLDKDTEDYTNYSGTGNTFKANHSVVRRLILDSLRYWVTEMHVDGFRFDLASILTRDETGKPMPTPPILWDIITDPVLSGSKLIAEAWDAAGLYQLGSFGDLWKEWNGKFRDDIRAFIKGDGGSVAKLPNRLFASPDIFGHAEQEPETSINFITCHDGFTLNDLVSYDTKHNEANNEHNQDGCNNNISWNCGVEGPTDNASIIDLRKRQMKNCLALTVFAAGTPLLLMGDEVCRTQRGNNNAYCQDNEISWFDWSLSEKNADMHRFVKQLIRLRLALNRSGQELSPTLNQLFQELHIEYHGIKLNHPDWGWDSRSLAILLAKPRQPYIIYFIFNSFWEALEFDLPDHYQNITLNWSCIIDTAKPSPYDCVEISHATRLNSNRYPSQPRSVVVLIAKH